MYHTEKLLIEAVGSQTKTKVWNKLIKKDQWNEIDLDLHPKYLDGVDTIRFLEMACMRDDYDYVEIVHETFGERHKGDSRWQEYAYIATAKNNRGLAFIALYEIFGVSDDLAEKLFKIATHNLCLETVEEIYKRTGYYDAKQEARCLYHLINLLDDETLESYYLRHRERFDLSTYFKNPDDSILEEIFDHFPNFRDNNPYTKTKEHVHE